MAKDEQIQASEYEVQALFFSSFAYLPFLKVKCNVLYNTFAIQQLLGVLPLNSSSLTAPIVTRKSS